MKKENIDLSYAIRLYEENGSLHKTAKILHTSHIRLSKLLKDYNVTVNNVGNRKDITDSNIDRIKIMYEGNSTIDEISKALNITVKKVRGILKKENIKTGRWHKHEKQKKAIVKAKKTKPFKKCPYCEWKTYDINNYSHSYSKHIMHTHNIDISEHLSKYPDDAFFFEKILKRRSDKIQCKICGKYLFLIDDRHLKKHNMSKKEYIEKYGENVISDSCKNKLHICINRMNNNPNWQRFTSTYEASLHDLLSSLNIVYEKHKRDIIPPNEIDIYIPSKNIAIEFNGNKYHTEWFGGKSRLYHLEKTNLCKEQNIGLIHIFEDEFQNSKEIVFNKIAHILGTQQNLPKIYGRKCIIKQILKNDADIFLSKFHIQGYASSTIHYGAFHEEKLIAVMSFKTENNGSWELTRFASDYNYICCGVGGKLFKHFIKEYNPVSIKSFADRRWTVDEENNIYCQLGFEFDGYTAPDYSYYNCKVDKYKRFHKFGFRKQTLLKKYPDILTPEMTETEMVKELGYDRIWNCGLIRYVWKNEQ